MKNNERQDLLRIRNIPNDKVLAKFSSLSNKFDYSIYINI